MHTTKITINDNPVTLQVPDDDSDDPTSVEWKPPQKDKNA